MAKDGDDKVKTDLESVNAMADRLKLKGSDRDDYVHRHMRGLGYSARRTYVAPDDDDSEGGGFFGSKRNRRSDDDDI